MTIAWELRDGVYVEAARALGAESFVVATPSAIEFQSTDLLS